LVGRRIIEIVGKRLGKAIIELEGNNIVIISEHANLQMAIKSVVFGAVGFAGQRCNLIRSLVIHESVFKKVIIIFK
jgi:aldehyde dehydrogenase (NAD+)